MAIMTIFDEVISEPVVVIYYVTKSFSGEIMKKTKG